MRSILNNLKFENESIYKIPCGNFNEMYVGQTTSTLNKHHLDSSHKIDFNNFDKIVRFLSSHQVIVLLLENN